MLVSFYNNNAAAMANTNYRWVKIRTVYLKITLRLFLLFVASVYKHINYVQANLTDLCVVVVVVVAVVVVVLRV